MAIYHISEARANRTPVNETIEEIIGGSSPAFCFVHDLTDELLRRHHQSRGYFDSVFSTWGDENALRLRSYHIKREGDEQMASRSD